MMTNENLLKILPDNYQKFYDNNVFDRKDKCKQKSIVVKKSSLLTDKDDKLFWTFYELHFKNSFLEMDKNFKTEKEFKIKTIEKLHLFKDKLKNYKLKIQDLENELLNEKKITNKGFMALCLIYGINLFYFWDYKYIEILSKDNGDLIYIRNDKDSEIKILTKEEADKLIENYYFVENIEKWLKSISGYTKTELLNICTKLKIDIKNSKVTKENLYEVIGKKINIM